MSYLREAPQKLRVSDCTSLRDLLVYSGRVEDDSSAVRGARLFNLMSTLVGGARFMRQQMHKSIAVLRKAGHMDTSLTVTCSLS